MLTQGFLVETETDQLSCHVSSMMFEPKMKTIVKNEEIKFE